MTDASALTLFQIYFADWQRAHLDADLTPYDNANCTRPDEREFYVFRHEYLANPPSENEVRGYLSWKFTDKSGLTGNQFKTFISQNPGYDVYFVHPFPIETTKGNVWTQGELYHPGLTKMAEHILEATGHPTNLAGLPATLRLSAACNFWAGNRRFWDEYMSFCLPIYEYVRERLPTEIHRRFFGPADRTISASYFSFTFERLFTTFLALRPDLRAKAYVFTDGELLAKYGDGRAAIVSALQAQEARHPDVTEPHLMDPLLLAAMSYYDQAVRPPTPRAALYALARSLWARLPARVARLANRGDQRRNRRLRESIAQAKRRE